MVGSIISRIHTRAVPLDGVGHFVVVLWGHGNDTASIQWEQEEEDPLRFSFHIIRYPMPDTRFLY